MTDGAQEQPEHLKQQCSHIGAFEDLTTPSYH